MKRVIGQCHQHDIRFIEHLVRVVQWGRDDMLDYSTLTKNQRIALLFVKEALERKISWALIKSAVHEVLVWGDGSSEPDDGEIEVKFYPDREKARLFRNQWFAT